MAPFERLEVWRSTHDLVLAIYRLTASWPTAERFGLASQIRRAAASIPTCLAEGSAKRGPREFRRFVDIALGSMSELTYLLRLAADLGYISKGDHASIETHREQAGKLLWGLYRSLSSRC